MKAVFILELAILNLGGMTMSCLVLVFLLLTGLIVLSYKIRKQDRQLCAIRQSKEKLFAMLASELGGPLRSLGQLLRLMDDEDMSREEGKELVQLMQQQAASALKNLQILQKWGENDTDAIRVEAQVFDPYYYISKNIELLKREISSRNLSIRPTIHRQLRVLGDPQHFDFIINNLLSNAIKFSHDEGIIEILARRDADNMVLFEIIDHGTGISRLEKGAELVLHLIKLFVSANRGQTRQKSLAGNGAAFIFSFTAASQ